jgi:hypothetical protein
VAFFQRIEPVEYRFPGECGAVGDSGTASVQAKGKPGGRLKGRLPRGAVGCPGGFGRPILCGGCAEGAGEGAGDGGGMGRAGRGPAGSVAGEWKKGVAGEASVSWNWSIYK